MTLIDVSVSYKVSTSKLFTLTFVKSYICYIYFIYCNILDIPV